MKSIRIQLAMVLAIFGIALGSTIVLMTLFTSTNLREQNVQLVKQAIFQRYDAKVKTQIQTAVSTLQTIYRESSGDKQAALKRSQEILTQMRYEDDRSGYFFAYDFSGINRAHATNPEFVGTNRLNIVDANGTPYIREFIAQGILERKKSGASAEFLARNTAAIADAENFLTGRQKASDGFTEYYFTKSTDLKNLYLKRGYSLAVEGLDWVIGTGNYVDDIEKEVQQYQTTLAKYDSISLVATLQVLLPMMFFLMFFIYIYIFRVINGVVDIGLALSRVSLEDPKTLEGLSITGSDEIATAKIRFNDFLLTLKNSSETSQVKMGKVSDSSAQVIDKVSVSLKKQQATLTELQEYVDDPGAHSADALVTELLHVVQELRGNVLATQNILEVAKDIRDHVHRQV